MSDNVFEDTRELNMELKMSGYEMIELRDVNDKEVLGVLVLRRMNDVVDEMEVTVQGMEDFAEAKELADDTYLIEKGFDIARECLIDR